MKHKLIKWLFAAALLATPLFFGGAAEAQAGETLELTKIFITEDKEDDGSSQFKQVYERDGISYRLKSVTARLLEEVLPGDRIIYDSPPFVGNTEEYTPAEIVEREGKTYRLKTCELINVNTEETEEYSEASISYEGVEYIDSLPEAAKVRVTKDSLKQEIDITLPAVRYEEEETYWDYSFHFPITVTGYDADSYMLGQTEIPDNAPLIDYASEFLQYLKLPEAYYQITSIEWEGEPMSKEGKVVRKAVASGRKLVKDIQGTYGGQVKFPSAAAKKYHCEYVEENAENQSGKALYRKEATAIYEQEEKESINLWDFLKRLFKWLLTHLGALAALLILLFLLVILFILAPKWKQKQEAEEPEEEEEEDETV